jgi:TP901 family phage tail tape measure protein
MARGRTLTLTILGNAKGATNALRSVAGESKTFGDRMAGLGKAAGLAFAATGAAAGALGTVALGAFARFDAAMTQSTAIMSGVTDDMRKQMEQTARTVSKTMGVSAEESARSFFYLASAGLNAEQSIAALPQVAAFAKAGMFDMALATDLATDAQSALGLTSKDTETNLSNLTRVTDVLVKANTLANANVQQFSTSLTTKAGAALKSVGKDIEEGVAVLAAFADQGIKGEEAGTQFAIVMRDLQTKALKNSGAFKQFGVEVFNSTGEMNNLGEIVGMLEGALAGMSDEQRKATLAQMGFSDKSMGAIAALIGTSDKIKEYETALRDAGGTTQDVADKQLETFSQQMALLRAQFTDFAITIGSRIAPVILNFVEMLQTYVFPVVDRIVKAFDVGGIGGAFGQIQTEIEKIIPVVVTKLNELGQKLVDWIKPRIPQMLAALAALLPRLATWVLRTRDWLVTKLIEWGNALSAWITPMLPKLFAKLGEFLVAMGNWIAQVGLPMLVERAQKLGDALVSWLGPLLRRLPSLLVDLTATIAKWILSTGIPALVKYGTKLGLSLIKWTATLGKDLLIGLGGALVALVAALPSLFASFFVGLGKIGMSAVGFFMAKFSALRDKIAQLAVNAVNYLIEKFNAIPLIPNIDKVTIDTKKLGDQMSLTADELDTVKKSFRTGGSDLNKYGSAVEDLRFKTRGATTATKDLNAAITGSPTGDDGGGTGGGGGGGTKGGANKAAEAMKKYGDQLKTVQEKSRSVTEAQRSLVKAQDAAKEAAKQTVKAQERFNLVVGGFPKSSKEAIAASKAMEDASKRLRDAKLREGDSVRNVEKAERRLADLRAIAADPASVAEAERGLTRAKFRVEQANFDVIDAERELAQLRSDPQADPIEIRKKEIALEEAKLSVIDATLGEADAVKKLDDERNRAATAEELAEAERDLARAKIAVMDSIDEVRDATVEQGLAQAFLDEIVNGAREGSERYKEALDALNDAREKEVDAIDAVASALQRERDATYELLQARRELAALADKLTAEQVAKVTAGFEKDYGVSNVASTQTGNGDRTVNINVDAKPMQNKSELANEIIDALKLYERSNGLIPLQVGSFVGVL